jgi:hypothetical protein
LEYNYLLKKEKTTQTVKTAPRIISGKGATLVMGFVKLLHHKGKEKEQWGSEGF